jgi:hypothetical protein
MMSARYHMQLDCSSRSLPLLIILVMITLLATKSNMLAAGQPPVVTSGTASGTVGVAFSYQIIATNSPTSYGTTVSVPGVGFSTTTGLFSGTPTTAGTYTGNITATNNKGTGSGTLVITITNPAPPNGLFVGFRLPDFPPAPTPAPTPAAKNMQLMLQVGATQAATAHPFNATLEVDAGGAGTGPWIPYNRFIGIDDTASWITSAPLNVRELPGSAPAPAPYPSPPAFGTTQLTQSPPGVYMKADPRSTRFGIFQEDSIKTGNSRIIESLWPANSTALPNGYGGTVGTTFSPTTVDVEHAPLRFNGNPYYPATFAINGPADARDTTTTTYTDNDGVTRPADAIYPDVVVGTGSSTPYYPTSNTASSYHPTILNRPFRNVGELGYVFRDLPWKTLDLFNQNSADAGLLDVFCINDGPRSTAAYNANGDLGTIVPPMVAGTINLNTGQTGGLQAVLAGAIWGELDSPLTTVSPTGGGAQTAGTMATNIATATSATLMKNKTELITRASLPTTILPVTSSQDNQTVKARREVVPRAITSVSQTRVWNLLIDVVAQSGRYAPGQTDPTKFIVEGEQHYWVHVAIDRFTGEVIDKQIEVVKE